MRAGKEMKKREATKHKRIVDYLAQHDDFEARLDEVLQYPDFRLCSPETVREYREILIKEVLKARGQ